MPFRPYQPLTPGGSSGFRPYTPSQPQIPRNTMQQPSSSGWSVVKSIPSMALHQQGDFTSGIIKGAAKTALGAAELGSGIMEKGYNATIGKLTGKDAFKGADMAKDLSASQPLQPTNLTQKVGGFAEKAGEMLTPIGIEEGVASKGAMVAKDVVEAGAPKLAGTAIEIGSKAVGAGTEQFGKTLTQTGGDVEEAKKQGLAVGATTGVAEVAGQALTSALQGKKIAPFESSVNHDAIAAANGEEMNLPVSAMSKSPAVQGLEAISSKGLFGAKLRQSVSTTKRDLETMSEDIQSSIQPNRTYSPESIGNFIKKGFSDYVDVFNKKKSDIYQEASDLMENNAAKYGTTPANTDHAVSALDEIISQKQKAGAAANKSEIDYFKAIRTDLQKEMVPNATGAKVKVPDIRDFSSHVEGTPDIKTDRTFDDLKAMRTEIGAKMQSSADPVATGNRAQLKKLYAALSDDLDVTASEISPDFAKKVDDANAYYRDTLSKVNSTMGKQISDMNPEDLVGKFVQPNSPTDIRQLREIGGDDAFEKVQSSFITDLIKKSTTKEGAFDPGLLKKNFSKWDRPTLEALLEPEQLDKLDEAITRSDKHQLISGALKTGTKMADGSQTAFLENLSGKGIVGLGGAATLWFHNPIFAVASILGDAGMAKFLASPGGKEFLTTGLTLDGASGAYLRKLAPQIAKARAAYRVSQKGSNKPRALKPPTP